MENKPFTLGSPVFNEGDIIPNKYTCKGTGISPPLSIENTPEATASLAINRPRSRRTRRRFFTLDSLEHQPYNYRN